MNSWLNLDFWRLLAGLGLFLLGMQQLEVGLQSIGSHRIRKFLGDYTNTPLRGVATGTIATAILQSSSMVGLITLAFVGAGLMPLVNALGIIIGANLGTTFTGWLVTTIGFKLNLDSNALPFLSMGALGLVLLNPESQVSKTCRIILGFGLLLLGLGYMKTAMSFLQDAVGPDLFKNYPLLVFALAGMIFTALIQSSSATMVIVLSAMSHSLLPLPNAAAIIVGADLGTTGTILLAAIGGTADRKRVALSHFSFNLVTDLIALLLIFPLLYLITDLLGLTDPMYALVMFHSCFNLMGILIFLPFLKPFTAFLNKRFIESDIAGCRYIRGVSPKIVEAAYPALIQETERLLQKTIALNLRSLRLSPAEILVGYKSYECFTEIRQLNLTFDEQYLDLKRTEGQLVHFAYQVLKYPENSISEKNIEKLLSIIRNTLYSAKSLKDIRHNILDLKMQEGSESIMSELHKTASVYFKNLLQLLEKTDRLLVDERSKILEKEIEHSHQLLHEQVVNLIQSEIPIEQTSAIFNINRELYVSQNTLRLAVSDFTLNFS